VIRLLLCFLLTVVVAAPAIADEAPLGRLFFTPQQRAALDNARRNKIRSDAVAGAVVKKPRPPVARSVVINGVVKRSDGETIVWVNGKPVEGETPDGMQFQVAPETKGAVLVREPDQGRRVEIKVGQQVDMNTGRIKEPFERSPQTTPPAPGSPQRERGLVLKRTRTTPFSPDDMPADELPQEPPPQNKPQQ